MSDSTKKMFWYLKNGHLLYGCEGHMAQGDHDQVIETERDQIVYIEDGQPKIAQRETARDEHLAAAANYRFGIKQMLEQQIYRYYPIEKQTHDNVWGSEYTARLQAIGFGNVGEVIAGYIQELEKKPLKQAVKETVLLLEQTQIDKVLIMVEDVDDVMRKSAVAYMLQKLAKVAIRRAWVEGCKWACKAAVARGIYPNFPPAPLQYL